jgi:hypothetical protein
MLLFAIATETLNVLMAKTETRIHVVQSSRDSLEFILSLITTDLMVHSFAITYRIAKECKTEYV